MLTTKNNSWFSIIEILIGMFIFSLWIISIYAIISSSVRINEYNKNYIIAANLAREQLELLRNNRDFNYEVLQKFDQINPHGWDYNLVFQDGMNYKIGNNIINWSFPVKIEEISSADFADEKNYQLCLDGNMYIYCPVWTTLKQTPFFKYVHIDRSLWDEKLKITSKVIWKSKWEHEFEVKTILSDWKQL
jgi:hypothetical protein